MELLPLHTLKTGANTASLRLEKILPIQEKAVSSSHRHDFFEIFLFSKGGGQHMIDFELHPLTEKSLNLVYPGQVHQVSRVAPSEGWVIMFSRDFLLSLLGFQVSQQQVSFLNQPPAAAAVVLSEADFTLLQTLFVQLENAQSGTKADWHNPELVRALVKVMVLKCAELLEPAAPKKQTHTDAAGCRLAREFSRLVEEHYKQLHQVCDYADKLAVTSGHLNVVSKTWLHKTAREVIQERLLLEAKRLLLHSGLAGKEIAYALNFEDPSHFAKFFKSHCQVSPTEFRQQIREIYQQ